MKMGKIMLNGIEYGGYGSSGGAVSGVKGNAESSYRIGNVNLTPENIGAISCREIHNGDFNNIIDPGFYSMNGASTKNGPASGGNNFSLIVLDNSGTQGANYPTFHQIAIEENEATLYIRFGIPSIEHWSNWEKMGLKVKTFFSGSQSFTNGGTRISLSSVSDNVLNLCSIFMIQTSRQTYVFPVCNTISLIERASSIQTTSTNNIMEVEDFQFDYTPSDSKDVIFSNGKVTTLAASNFTSKSTGIIIEKIIGIGF